MELVTYVDGVAWARVAAGDMGARAWLLGVVAVQVAVEGGRLRAQVRSHLTGAAAAEVRALGAVATVQVQLLAAGAAPPPPPVPPAPLGDQWARLSLSLDGRPLDEVTLPHGAAEQTRAFGHVYCRFLRDGTVEPGCDLTEFLCLPPGTGYQRRLHRPLTPGATVGYTLVSRA